MNCVFLFFCFCFLSLPLCFIKPPDEESVHVALNCVEIACRCGYVSALESAGCMDALESVIYHGTSDALRGTASRLWDTYFEGEEEEEEVMNDFNPSGIDFGNGGGGGFGTVNNANNVNNGGVNRGGAVIPAWAMNQ